MAQIRLEINTCWTTCEDRHLHHHFVLDDGRKSMAGEVDSGMHDGLKHESFRSGPCPCMARHDGWRHNYLQTRSRPASPHPKYASTGGDDDFA